MKKELEDMISEETPRYLRKNILEGAHRIIRNEPEPSVSFWSWLLRPQTGGVALAGGLAVLAVVVTTRPGANDGAVPTAAPTQYEAEMLRKADMLLDLDVLEHWDALKKGPTDTWRKKKG